ncbi:hypothetical protein ACHAXH_002712 [Discostella pseudostelligera]
MVLPLPHTHNTSPPISIKPIGISVAAALMTAQRHLGQQRWKSKQNDEEFSVGVLRKRRSLSVLLLSLQLGASSTCAFQATTPLMASAAVRRHIITTTSQLQASLQSPLPDSRPASDSASSPSGETNLSSLLTQHHTTPTISIISIGSASESLSPPASESTSESASLSSSSPSHILSMDKINPIFKFEKNGKPKVLNIYGLYHLFVIVITMPFWMASMEMLHWLGNNIQGFDEDRAKFDYAGKLWCRAYLTLTDCYPQIEGDVSRLQDKVEPSSSSTTAENGPGACLFVANHASFLDIPVLCCVLDPVFKFIAKDSLMKFPGVGRQLVGGEHVLIDRTDKRSQLRTFKQAITYLKNGTPIMAFPEGARSPDGRLMPFKGGIFSMAVKAKVPIVPLSLSNTHAVFPSVGFLPVQSGRDKLRVYVHDPIDVEGKSEEEIAFEVRRALLRELPLDQHPLEVGEDNL